VNRDVVLLNEVKHPAGREQDAWRRSSSRPDTSLSLSMITLLF